MLIKNLKIQKFYTKYHLKNRKIFYLFFTKEF